MGSDIKLTGDNDFDELLASCVETLKVKGDDYTMGSEDRLHNFKTVGGFCGLTPKEVLGVYFYKHVSAIFSYIKKDGQSESEPIEGRIMDSINYLLLFYKMIKEEERRRMSVSAEQHTVNIQKIIASIKKDKEQ